MLNIQKLVTGSFEANQYIVWTEGETECLVIDPGEDSPALETRIESLGLTPVQIVLTHGHFDHIAGVRRMKEKFGGTICIHSLDGLMLVDARENLSAYFGFKVEQPAADRFLEEGDTVAAGSTVFKVIHPPGHSPGGICLIGESVVFTGDTLFCESVGRTDFPKADGEALIKAIKQKLLTLPDDMRVYPGHGPVTTIGHERQANIFIRQALRKDSGL